MSPFAHVGAVKHLHRHCLFLLFGEHIKLVDIRRGIPNLFQDFYNVLSQAALGTLVKAFVQGTNALRTALRPSRTALRLSRTALGLSRTALGLYRTALRPSRTALGPSRTALGLSRTASGLSRTALRLSAEQCFPRPFGLENAKNFARAPTGGRHGRGGALRARG